MTGRKTPTTITYNNKTITDPIKIANAFNEHYITIGQKTINRHNPKRSSTNTPEHTHSTNNTNLT